MGQSVTYLDVLKLLNQSELLTMSRNDVSSTLKITDSELESLVSYINNIYYLINSDSNSLSLDEPLDLLDADRIYKKTVGSGRIVILPETDSTNTYMLNHAGQIASGDTVIAELQNSGRGRRGGKWFSTFGRQITMSVCYVFDDLDSLVGLSLGIGVAAARAIESFGFEDVTLKWPNDILRAGKKLGGILIETVPYNGKIKAVIGIGLNIYPERFIDLERPVDSVFREFKQDLRNEIAIALINNIKEISSMYACGQKGEILNSFRDRDSLLGSMISVENNCGIFTGRACGIDDQGALVIVQDEVRTAVSSGHVEYC
ncbi:MAG: biotin--[acetyl-CoA-carboxylase] ligase [Succinivibrio sp.]